MTLQLRQLCQTAGQTAATGGRHSARRTLTMDRRSHRPYQRTSGCQRPGHGATSRLEAWQASVVGRGDKCICCRRSKCARVVKRVAAVEPAADRQERRILRGAPVATALEIPAAIKQLMSHNSNRGVTPFRSVSLMVRTGRYDVTPHHFKRQVYLGSYDTPEQAARVADLAEVATGKTGTRLNFEGEYGAEVERAAEVAATPGMTDDSFKVRH